MGFSTSNGVDCELIAEFDLEKKPLTSDFFILNIDEVRRIVIVHSKKRYLFQLRRNQNNSNIVYEIPMENIREADISYEWTGKKEKRKDLLIQLIFDVDQRYDRKRLRTIRLNVQDKDIDNIITQINRYRENNK